ncbi:MAG: enoyl-CoA hydratase/isomerase family protein [Gammaproteobacteria bacterium]|nr:enoyl-CoA hydratase/isomerase family protein [Gammaproteobacteria bacterium]
MSYNTLLVEKNNSVATISFNRPLKLNAFDKEMVLESQNIIESVTHDDAIKVVIITGIGKGFSAGADLSDPSGMDDHSNDRLVYEGLVNGYMPSLVNIMNMPKPVIAAVNGPAAGIGSAFALACDLMVMSDNAYLKQAFVNIALIPDGGLNWLLTRSIGYKLAYEMAIEGDNIPASKCLDLGLTNKVVKSEELMTVTMDWAESLSRKSSQSLRETKKVMRTAMTSTYEEVFKLEAEANNSLHSSEDSLEAVQAFFEKREPNFK